MHQKTASLASHETAVTVLRRLHEIGAINLDVIVNSGEQVGSILADVGIDDWDLGICYKHYIRVFWRGPFEAPTASLHETARAIQELQV